MNIEIRTYNGQVFCEEYTNDQRQLHREDGPAVISRNKVTLLLEEIHYCINGALYRDNDLPAFTSYHYNTEVIEMEKWYFNGKRHRGTKPAAKLYFPDGSIKTMEWFNHGLRHNLGGAATIHYKRDGTIDNVKYYIDGVMCFSREQYEKELELYGKDYFKISGRSK